MAGRLSTTARITVMRKANAMLVVVLLAVVGCSKTPSPTEPVTPPVATVQARLDFGIATIDSSETIRRVKLTFDGRDVTTVTLPAASKSASISGTVDWPVGGGQHVIRIVILDQTSSPTAYGATGSVIMPRRIADLITVRETLATGEGLQFKVTL